MFCGKVENGNLLPWLAFESAGAFARDECAIIGVATDLASHTHIFHQETDISYGVVFTFARSSYDSYAFHTSCMEVLYSFSLVVGFLVRVMVNK
jgi:hypothetical protein